MLRPKFRIELGGRSILVSPIHEYARNLFNWHPNWKTSCIAKIIQSRPGILLDVGTNVGQTLFDYLSTGVRYGYVGFEPSSRCVDQLNEIIMSNALSDCIVIPVALSNMSGILRIYTDSLVDPDATILKGLRPSQNLQSYFAATFCYDTISQYIPLTDRVSLVKIDVECAEVFVVEGMKQLLHTDTPWILCEVLTIDLNADPTLYVERYRKLMSLLNSSEYFVFRIEQSADTIDVTGLIPCYEFPEVGYTTETKNQCDYLFVPRKDAANAKALFGSLSQ